MKLPGQPWSSKMGMASLRREKRAQRWTEKAPSLSEMLRVKCGKVLRWASCCFLLAVG